MIFTNHAKDQLWNRFKLLPKNVKPIYENAIPFGIQRGKSLMLLNEDAGCVFVVQDDIIITVLTKELAIANMQCKNFFEIDVKSTNFVEKQKEEDIKVIEKIAKEMFKEHGIYASGAEYKYINKQINNSLREHKLDVNYYKKEYNKIVAKLIYENNKLDKLKS